MSKQPTVTFKKLEKDTAHEQASQQRNMSGSLEQCKDELRDAYMNFKDLQMRCVIDIKPSQVDSEDNEGADQVYYFRPDTFLLEDPEKQNLYRQHLLKKVAGIPKPEQIHNLGDDLHKSMSQAIADRSGPKESKKFLSEFFKRRQYTLQHMKYKLLCRWAHLNMTSENIENISADATFIYGKLEFNLEQAMIRHERLSCDDFYDKATKEARPTTRTAETGTALYVEKFDLQPQSLIRDDDVEVYMRGVSHRNKILKTVNKFMGRLKWLPLAKKWKIFEEAVEQAWDQVNKNIERQNELKDQIKERYKKHSLPSADLEREVDAVLKQYHCSRFEAQFMSQNDRTLNLWRNTHEEVPRLIADQQRLKVRIMKQAAYFNLRGDIEMDHGYTYCYQVTIFFPGYFQKQVLKSQFSVYDLEEDPNQSKKRTLQSMVRIDTNIFRDVSTTKNQVGTDEAINAEMRNSEIKVMRLRSSDSWIHYIILQPTECEWYQKQQALLNIDNPIDSLLRAGFNFLDVHDMATINRINEDNSALHQKSINKLLKSDPNSQIVRTTLHTQDGEKVFEVDKSQFQKGRAAELEHSLHAVQGRLNDEDASKPNQVYSIQQLPSHLLNSHYTLRYMSSRDNKTRLLYILNYFRSVQKRMAIDLREFATRDRLESHQPNPFVHSKEANQSVLNQALFASKAYEKVAQNKKTDVLQLGKNMTVFDEKAIEKMRDMASFRSYKIHGLFNNKVFSTCPSYHRYHASNGEPLTRQPEAEELDKKAQNKSISEQGIRLMGRCDTIEINEALKEVYVRDDFGIYLMYDSALQDMKFFEETLLKIGSYFIHRAEVLEDPTKGATRPVPCRDRLQIIDDILQKEMEFNFLKVKLCQVYLECYEHVCDPLEQQKLMQIITDIMARRPRLDLNASYFTDAYDAEITCLSKQFDLIRTIVDTQISLEKTEASRLQDSLDMSFFMSKKYSEARWSYQNAEDLLETIVKNKENSNLSESEKFIRVEKQVKDSVRQSINSQFSQKSNEQSATKIHKQPTFGEDDDGQFTKLLGLPQITIESIYQGYREKDHNILKVMGEHAHFIEVHEGYPEFLTRLTHRSIITKNQCFKPSPWSQPCGSLDFYETLDFVTRFYAVSQQCMQELHDGHKMWSPLMMTHVDIKFTEHALEEWHRVIRIMEGGEEEYVGRALFEDEQVMGSADKMTFYAKEMLADLTKKPKPLVNPFLICKLDIETIKFFDFAKLKANQNQYTIRSKTGVVGADYLIQAEKNALVGVAKAKGKEQQFTDAFADLMEGKKNDITNRRNIVVPSQLKVYCNMMELHRLRSEIIIAASECAMLGQAYQSQCAFAGFKMNKLMQEEPIAFDILDFPGPDQDLVNYVDHGPSHKDFIGLAISEFDTNLLSNANFRNPDSFKINVLTSGLEEMRAVLHYQLLQKHVLIVATRMNQLLLDYFERALAEISLVQKWIAVPNNNISYKELLNGEHESINGQALKEERMRVKQNLSSFATPLFYSINGKKAGQRGQIAKEFSDYQSLVVQEMPHDDYCIRRVARAHKVRLLNRFCTQTLTDIYLDAGKVHAVHACQQLRQHARYFMYDPASMGMITAPPQLFEFESCPLQENFPDHYLPPSQSQDALAQNQKLVKPFTGREITDFFGIPSTKTLLELSTTALEDTREYKTRRLELRAQKLGTSIEEEKDDLKDIDPKLSEPEDAVKRYLPTFTPINLEDYSKPASLKSKDEEDQKPLNESKLDYQEALNFGESSYLKVTNYYAHLCRIFQIEWFIAKIQFRPEEQIQISSMVDSGQPFWLHDEFERRSSKEPMQRQSTMTKTRAEKFFIEEIMSIRQKRNLAEAVSSVACTLKSMITQYQKTKKEKREEYLLQYTEFRYQQVVGCLYRLQQQFAHMKKFGQVHAIRQALAEITKMQHTKVKFLKPNNYSVSASIISAEQFALESGNFIFGAVQHQDTQNFERCIQPIVNERALEPAQITLFKSIYKFDTLRMANQSQFAGQWCSTANSQPFKAFETALLNLSAEDRVYIQTFIVQAKFTANDFMETVFNDPTLSGMSSEDAYKLDQLIDAKKFLNETTQAVLLKNAMICWYEDSALPDTSEQYERFEANFRQNFFWKQLDQKEELIKKANMSSAFGSMPSQSHLKELRERIDFLASDNSLPTEEAEQRRDELIKTLKEEYQQLRKKVTLDQYFSTKAEIQVFSNEIEKFMIRASVRTLDDECQALTKCFEMQVPKIQYHIHPFQQFAATAFDTVDPNKHMDIANKITAIQSLLTKLRNRATEVETLTSGPGLVITVKDFNESLVEFCKDTVKAQEKQFKSRQDTFFLKEQAWMEKLYERDQRIRNLENRIKNIGVNLENIIDARLFEKGNQMIFALDNANRLLAMFKQSMADLETNLFTQIQNEQMEKFKRKLNLVELKTRKFDEYKKTIQHMIEKDFAEDQDRVKEEIKMKAEIAKNTSLRMKAPEMYPLAAAECTCGAQSNTAHAIKGALVPQGFEHYPTCSCYMPSEKHPRPTLDLARKDMLSEAEARAENAQLCDLLRKQRVMHLTKEMLMIEKYQKEINKLKTQLNSNASLWHQLAESEKRELVLKQELLLTQQTLSNAEKKISFLDENLKRMDAERGRLQTFKTDKAELLRELESRVKQYEVAGSIDTDKLVAALLSQASELKDQAQLRSSYETRLGKVESQNAQRIRTLKRQLQEEQMHSQAVVDKMEQLKVELSAVEKNDASAGAIWKKKCLDLFEVCQAMKTQNEELRVRCKELISQGLVLAETIGTHEDKLGFEKSYTANPSTAGHTNARSLMQKSVMTPTPMTTYSHETARQMHNKSELGQVNKQLRSPFRDATHTRNQRKRTIDPLERTPNLPPQSVRDTLLTQQHFRPMNDIKSILQNGGIQEHRRKLQTNAQRQREDMRNRKQSNQTQDSIFKPASIQEHMCGSKQSSTMQQTLPAKRLVNPLGLDLQGKQVVPLFRDDLSQPSHQESQPTRIQIQMQEVSQEAAGEPQKASSRHSSRKESIAGNELIHTKKNSEERI